MSRVPKELVEREMAERFVAAVISETGLPIQILGAGNEEVGEPDVLLDASGCRVGLELTVVLHHPSEQSGQHSAALAVFCDSIEEGIQKIPEIFVRVHLSDGPRTPRDGERLAKEVIDRVAMWNGEGLAPGDERALEEYACSVRLKKLATGTKSRVMTGWGVTVPPIEHHLESVRAAIEGKRGNDYVGVNETWLLLHDGTLNSASGDLPSLESLRSLIPAGADWRFSRVYLMSESGPARLQRLS